MKDFHVEANIPRILYLTICIKWCDVTSFDVLKVFFTRREFLRGILYKNIAIISIQHSKIILFTPLAIFTILLGEIPSSSSVKFPYTY